MYKSRELNDKKKSASTDRVNPRINNREIYIVFFPFNCVSEIDLSMAQTEEIRIVFALTLCVATLSDRLLKYSYHLSCRPKTKPVDQIRQHLFSVPHSLWYRYFLLQVLIGWFAGLSVSFIIGQSLCSYFMTLNQWARLRAAFRFLERNKRERRKSSLLNYCLTLCHS